MLVCCLLFSSCEFMNAIVGAWAKEVDHNAETERIEKRYNDCLASAQTDDDKEKCKEEYDNDTARVNEKYREEVQSYNDKYTQRDKCEQYQRYVLQAWGYSIIEARSGAHKLREGSSTVTPLLSSGTKERVFTKNDGYEFDPSDAIQELIHQNYFDQNAIGVFARDLPKYGLSQSDAIKVIKQYYEDEIYTYKSLVKKRIRDKEYFETYNSKEDGEYYYKKYNIGNGVRVSKEILTDMGFIDEEDNDNDDDNDSVNDSIDEEKVDDNDSDVATKESERENNSDRKVIETPPVDNYQSESVTISKISVSKYGLNETQLTSEQKKELDEIVVFMKKWPASKITIFGHTCSIGSDAVNNAIGLRRAHEVKLYMLAHGIDENRIEEVSKAASEPCASNDTEEGRRQNRRITFIVK